MDSTRSPFIEETGKPIPYGHIGHIYATLEEWETAVAIFLITGLRQGEKCHYIVDTHTADQVRATLHAWGVDVTAAEASGQFLISHETETYTKGGFFDPDLMITYLINEAEKAIAEGYHAIRGVTEMSWVLHGHPGSNRFVEFESKLNRDFYARYPVTGLCQYEWQRFGLPLLLNVICTHPTIMVGTKVYENPYYIPDAEVLSRKQSPEDLKHWIEALTAEEKTRVKSGKNRARVA